MTVVCWTKARTQGKGRTRGCWVHRGCRKSYVRALLHPSSLWWRSSTFCRCWWCLVFLVRQEWLKCPMVCQGRCSDHPLFPVRYNVVGEIFDEEVRCWSSVIWFATGSSWVLGICKGWQGSKCACLILEEPSTVLIQMFLSFAGPIRPISFVHRS